MSAIKTERPIWPIILHYSLMNCLTFPIMLSINSFVAGFVGGVIFGITSIVAVLICKAK